MSTRPRRSDGFTLIELLVTLVIIAILAAIAVPSYRKYVVRANRTDAQRALVDLAARQERAFYSTNTYAKSLATLASSSSAAGANYTVSVASASSTGFVVTAAAIGTQQKSDTQCQTLSLTNTGARTSTGTTANDPTCWGLSK